jgi:uncharacterized SAM-binding protein YcdF (DUF218 family)
MSGSPGRVRRLTRPLPAGLLVAAVTLGAVTARWFVWPASAEPARADAIVVFAGGRGERLRTAVRLVEQGVATTLVISNGRDPGWRDANRLCAGWPGVTVLCPTPRPGTTEGEARMVAALAEQSRWRSVVLVTSTYHLRRASLLLRRCYPGQVEPVAARPSPSPVLITRVAHEWAGLLAALVFRQGC